MAKTKKTRAFECPEWLGSAAREEWPPIVERLSSRGLLNKSDVNVVARYCDTLSRWRRCSDFLDNQGECYPVRDESGQVKQIKQYPQVTIYNTLSANLLRLEQALGLSESGDESNIGDCKKCQEFQKKFNLIEAYIYPLNLADERYPIEEHVRRAAEKIRQQAAI